MARTLQNMQGKLRVDCGEATIMRGVAETPKICKVCCGGLGWDATEYARKVAGALLGNHKICMEIAGT